MQLRKKTFFSREHHFIYASSLTTVNKTNMVQQQQIKQLVNSGYLQCDYSSVVFLDTDDKWRCVS